MLNKKVNIAISLMFLMFFLCVPPSFAEDSITNNDENPKFEQVWELFNTFKKLTTTQPNCDDVIGVSSAYKMALDGRANTAQADLVPGRICQGDLSLNILYSIYQSPDPSVETLSSNPIYKMLSLSPSPAIESTLDNLAFTTTIIKIIIWLTNFIGLLVVLVAIKMATKLTLRSAQSGIMLGKEHGGFTYLSKWSLAILLVVPFDGFGNFSGVTHLVLGFALLGTVLANFIWGMFLSYYGDFLTPTSPVPPLSAAFTLSKSQVDALLGYNVCIIKNTERLVYNEMLELENGKNTFTNLPFLKLNNKKTQYESPDLESSLQGLVSAGVVGIYSGCAEKFFGSADDAIFPENLKNGLIKWGGSAEEDSPLDVGTAGVQIENNTLDEFPLLKDNLEVGSTPPIYDTSGIRDFSRASYKGIYNLLKSYDEQKSVSDPDWIYNFNINELITPDNVSKKMANKPRVVFTLSEYLRREIEEHSEKILNQVSSDIEDIKSQSLQVRPALYKNVILKELKRRQSYILSNLESPLLKQAKYFANYYHLTSCGKNIKRLSPSWMLVQSYNGGELGKHFDSTTGYKKEGVPKLESFSTDCVAYDIPWTTKAFANIPFLTKYFSDMNVYLLPLKERYSSVLETKTWQEKANKKGAFGAAQMNISTNLDNLNKWDAADQNNLNEIFQKERDVYLHYISTVLSMFTLRAAAIDAYLKSVDDSGEDGQSEYVAQIWKKGWAAAGGFMFDISKMMQAKNNNIYEIESSADRTLNQDYNSNSNYILPLFSNKIGASESVLFHKFYGHELSEKSFYPLKNTSQRNALVFDNSIREQKEFDRLNENVLQKDKDDLSKKSYELYNSPYLKNPKTQLPEESLKTYLNRVLDDMVGVAKSNVFHPSNLSYRMISPYKGTAACPTSIKTDTCGVPVSSSMTVLLQYGNDLFSQSLVVLLGVGIAKEWIKTQKDTIRLTGKSRLIKHALSIADTIITILLIMGFYVSHFLPLVPYVVFLLGVIGWLFIMFQALIALPVWLLSWMLTKDSNDGESHSSYADYKVLWEIFLNILMVPMLLVSGLVLAWSLSNYSIYYVNYLFSIMLGMNEATVPSWGDGFWYSLVSSMIYLLIVIIVIHMAFGLIQKLTKEVFMILESKYTGEIQEGNNLEAAMVAQQVSNFVKGLPKPAVELIRGAKRKNDVKDFMQTLGQQQTFDTPINQSHLRELRGVEQALFKAIADENLTSDFKGKDLASFDASSLPDDKAKGLLTSYQEKLTQIYNGLPPLPAEFDLNAPYPTEQKLEKLSDFILFNDKLKEFQAHQEQNKAKLKEFEPYKSHPELLDQIQENHLHLFDYEEYDPEKSIFKAGRYDQEKRQLYDKLNAMAEDLYDIRERLYD